MVWIISVEVFVAVRVLFSVTVQRLSYKSVENRVMDRLCSVWAELTWLLIRRMFCTSGNNLILLYYKALFWILITTPPSSFSPDIFSYPTFWSRHVDISAYLHLRIFQSDETSALAFVSQLPSITIISWSHIAPYTPQAFTYFRFIGFTAIRSRMLERTMLGRVLKVGTGELALSSGVRLIDPVYQQLPYFTPGRRTCTDRIKEQVKVNGIRIRAVLLCLFFKFLMPSL